MSRKHVYRLGWQDSGAYVVVPMEHLFHDFSWLWY